MLQFKAGSVQKMLCNLSMRAAHADKSKPKAVAAAGLMIEYPLKAE